jgi:hypothetical protein
VWVLFGSGSDGIDGICHGNAAAEECKGGAAEGGELLVSEEEEVIGVN